EAVDRHAMILRAWLARNQHDLSALPTIAQRHVALAELVEQNLAQHVTEFCLVHIEGDLLRNGASTRVRARAHVTSRTTRRAARCRLGLLTGRLVARAGGGVAQRRWPAAHATLARDLAVCIRLPTDEKNARCA